MMSLVQTAASKDEELLWLLLVTGLSLCGRDVQRSEGELLVL